MSLKLENFEHKHVHQIIAIAGEGKLKDESMVYVFR